MVHVTDFAELFFFLKNSIQMKSSEANKKKLITHAVKAEQIIRDEDGNCSGRNTPQNSATHFHTKIHPDDAIGQKKTVTFNLLKQIEEKSQSRIINSFKNNLKRLITPKEVPNEVEEFFSQIKSQADSDQQGWSQMRLDFLLFQLFRMFILLIFIFEFTVSTVVDFSIWQIYPVYGVFLIVEVVYKMNTKRFVDGELIITKPALRRHYIRNVLYKDLVLIPLIVLQALGINTYALKLLGLLKLTDVTEILDTVEMMICDTKRKSTAWDLFQNVCMNFLVAHLISLVLLGMTYGRDENWLIVKGLSAEVWHVKYCWAFYWATTTMLTVGYGDFSATNSFESIIVSLIEMTSIMMLAYTLSNIGELIRQYRLQDIDKFRKLKSINKFSKENNLDVELQLQAKHSIANMSDVKNFNIDEEDGIVRELPQRLRNEILVKSNKEKIRSLSLFTRLTNASVDEIAQKIERKVLYDGEIVLEKDVIPDKVLLLRKGVIQLQAVMKKGKEQVEEIRREHQNQCLPLGFVEVLKQCKTKLRYQSKGFSTICFISLSSLLEILKQKSIDYEVFCYTRDQIAILQNNIVSNLCEYCDMRHNKLDCPRFHYCPIKSIVILRKIMESRKNDYFQQRGGVSRHIAKGVKTTKLNIKQKINLNGLRKRVSMLKNRRSIGHIRDSDLNQVNYSEDLEYDKAAQFSIYFRKNNIGNLDQK